MVRKAFCPRGARAVCRATAGDAAYLTDDAQLSIIQQQQTEDVRHDCVFFVHCDDHHVISCMRSTDS
eukprot:2457840-Pleurochrysis_carterae.AAC.1